MTDRPGQAPVRQGAIRAFLIGAQIASALDVAHRHGLVHRDIKPQNVLMSSDGHVKVADSGIARAPDATQMTRSGVVLGTAAYVSPEQAEGLPAGFSSDIYALGVVLFEMLTARLRFDADSPVGMLMQHSRSEPPSVRSFNPSVSATDDAVVLRALRKDPEQRYAGAAEFARVLQREGSALDAHNTSYRPLPGVEDKTRVFPLSRRRKTFLLPLTLALAAVAGLGGWALHGGGAGIRGAPAPTSTKRPKPTSHRILTGARPSATATPTMVPTPAPTPRLANTPAPVVTVPSAIPGSKANGPGHGNGHSKGDVNGNGRARHGDGSGPGSGNGPGNGKGEGKGHD